MPLDCRHCINCQELEDRPQLSLYHQCESLYYFFQLLMSGVMTVSKHLSFAAVAKAVSRISLHISLFLSPSPLSWLCSWMIESAILYASCLSLVLCGGERERDRAEDIERELQLLMTVRSGKDEAALFDKLLFERDRYPRGTAVLEMWPTFLNGNGRARYSFQHLYTADDLNWSIQNSLLPS